MTAGDKFLALAGYLLCAAMIYPVDQVAAITMILLLLVVAYLVTNQDCDR